MQQKDPITRLREYIALQTALWARLTEVCNGPMGKFLLNVPTHGSVELEGRTWSFTKHGLGILFTEVDGKRKVDMHDAAAGVERIDSWRLATFFGGLGREGDKIVTQAIGLRKGTMDERVQLWLERLTEQGVLIVEGSGYRLCE